MHIAIYSNTISVKHLSVAPVLRSFVRLWEHKGIQNIWCLVEKIAARLRLMRSDCRCPLTKGEKFPQNSRSLPSQFLSPHLPNTTPALLGKGKQRWYWLCGAMLACNTTPRPLAGIAGLTHVRGLRLYAIRQGMRLEALYQIRLAVAGINWFNAGIGFSELSQIRVGKGLWAVQGMASLLWSWGRVGKADEVLFLGYGGRSDFSGNRRQLSNGPAPSHASAVFSIELFFLILKKIAAKIFPQKKVFPVIQHSQPAPYIMSNNNTGKIGRLCPKVSPSTTGNNRSQVSKKVLNGKPLLSKVEKNGLPVLLLISIKSSLGLTAFPIARDRDPLPEYLSSWDQLERLLKLTTNPICRIVLHGANCRNATQSQTAQRGTPYIRYMRTRPPARKQAYQTKRDDQYNERQTKQTITSTNTRRSCGIQSKRELGKGSRNSCGDRWQSSERETQWGRQQKQRYCLLGRKNFNGASRTESYIGSNTGNKQKAFTGRRDNGTGTNAYKFTGCKFQISKRSLYGLRRVRRNTGSQRILFGIARRKPMLNMRRAFPTQTGLSQYTRKTWGRNSNAGTNDNKQSERLSGNGSGQPRTSGKAAKTITTRRTSGKQPNMAPCRKALRFGNFPNDVSTTGKVYTTKSYRFFWWTKKPRSNFSGILYRGTQKSNKVTNERKRKYRNNRVAGTIVCIWDGIRISSGPRKEKENRRKFRNASGTRKTFNSLAPNIKRKNPNIKIKQRTNNHGRTNQTKRSNLQIHLSQSGRNGQGNFRLCFRRSSRRKPRKRRIFQMDSKRRINSWRNLGRTFYSGRGILFADNPLRNVAARKSRRRESRLASQCPTIHYFPNVSKTRPFGQTVGETRPASAGSTI